MKWFCDLKMLIMYLVVQTCTLQGEIILHSILTSFGGKCRGANLHSPLKVQKVAHCTLKMEECFFGANVFHGCKIAAPKVPKLLHGCKNYT